MADRLFSIAITVMILGVLIFSGPANAFVLSIESSVEKATVGEIVNFSVSVDVESDLLPIDYLALELAGPQDIECRFQVDGTIISGCAGMKIDIISNTGYSQGNLSGNYDGDSYNWGYGYGYGYGYEHGKGRTLLYSASLNTSGMLVGVYSTNFRAKISSDEFSRKGDDLTIESPISEGIGLRVISPDDKEFYNTKRVAVNVSTARIVKVIKYNDGNGEKTLCTDCREYSKKFAFNEGNHSLVITATDSYGSSEEKIINFFVDSKKPKIIQTYPRRNSFVNGSEFSVKYTEDNLVKVTLFYGNKSIIRTDCGSGRNNICYFNNVNLEEYNGKAIDYYFVLEDISGNTESSKPTVINAKTSLPNFDIVSPENKTYNQRRIPVSISLYD